MGAGARTAQCKRDILKPSRKAVIGCLLLLFVYYVFQCLCGTSQYPTCMLLKEADRCFICSESLLSALKAIASSASFGLHIDHCRTMS